MKRTIKLANQGLITVTTGSEGPAHDPYAYTEYTVGRMGHTVTLHAGLAEWVRVNGNLHEFQDDQYVSAFEKCADLFARYAGLTWKAIDAALDRIENRCPKGGVHADEVMGSGFVGETIYECRKCGRVCDNFDVSMIE